MLTSDFLPPYDAIHVGAAAESLPESLLNALKVFFPLFVFYFSFFILCNNIFLNY